MTKYPRTALCLCLGVFVLIVGCDGDGKSGSDTGADTSGTQQKQAQTAPSGDQAKAGDTDESGEVDQRKEATSKKGVVDQKAPLHVQEMFNPKRIAKLFEARPGELTRIPGREPSPDYNSQRLTFRGHDGFGLGVQVWAFDDTEEAESRFEDLRNQYLNADEAEVFPDQAEDAFSSVRGSLKTIVSFIGEPKPRIMAVTCDTSLCAESDLLEEIMEMVGERLETTYR
jgi:hypothetical protein